MRDVQIPVNKGDATRKVDMGYKEGGDATKKAEMGYKEGGDDKWNDWLVLYFDYDSVLELTSPHKVGAKPTNNDDDDQSPRNSGSSHTDPETKDPQKVGGTRDTKENDDQLPDTDEISYSNICNYVMHKLAGPQNAPRIYEAGNLADVSGVVHHDDEEDDEDT